MLLRCDGLCFMFMLANDSRGKGIGRYGIDRTWTISRLAIVALLSFMLITGRKT